MLGFRSTFLLITHCWCLLVGSDTTCFEILRGTCSGTSGNAIRDKNLEVAFLRWMLKILHCPRYLIPLGIVVLEYSKVMQNYEYQP